MIITEIIPVTKQKSRIKTDEQLTFVLYKGELSRYHLEVDQEITPELLEKIQREVLFPRAKLRAMHLLTKMDYTEADLRRKLLQGEYTEKAVEVALDYVKSYRYVDDQRYTEKYIRWNQKKKSKKQLMFELQQKGVEKEIIQQMSQTYETEEKDLILELLKKRCKNPSQADEKEKQRHYGYLMRKGFSSSDIQEIFRTFFR